MYSVLYVMFKDHTKRTSWGRDIVVKEPYVLIQEYGLGQYLELKTKYSRSGTQIELFWNTKQLLDLLIFPDKVLMLQSFFTHAPFESDEYIDSYELILDDVRQRLAVHERTLSGFGMELVLLCAIKYGCQRIELLDIWESPNNITSTDLRARYKEYAELIKKNARLPDNLIEVLQRYNVKEEDRAEFIEIIAKSGYYGKWGFNKSRPYTKVKTEDMMVLASNFA